MAKTAVHADKTIFLSFNSLTGHKYSTVYCVECGQPMYERSSDKIYRIGAVGYPETAKHDASGSILTKCHNCQQKYSMIINTLLSPTAVLQPFYMQPESLFMVIEPVKHLRDIHCVECGKLFYGISDRVNLISDNTIPVKLVSKDRYGSFESWCKFGRCRQRWSIFV